MGKTNEEKGLDYLVENISDGSKLPEVINVFKEMCRIPMDEEDGLQLLYEVGASDEKIYTIHLVRQTLNPEEEEYFQITVDVDFSYADTENQLNSEWENFWSFDLDGDFFEEIEKSRAFMILKEKAPIDINIFIDET